ncbi:predicted protein [Chaetoceros tenuissimus]|uniref:Uncharacterized protein n=1 Tax=Chaetoceros tenuissimus TaxID=426638 RepID=A0AAD3HBC0_9STRA|nr:predicted protein [Chaetoceros tenuissimus]
MDQNYYSSGIPCGACNGTGRAASTTRDTVKCNKEEDGSNCNQETNASSANLTYEMFLPDTKTDFDFISLAKAAAKKTETASDNDNKDL